MQPMRQFLQEPSGRVKLKAAAKVETRTRNTADEDIYPAMARSRSYGTAQKTNFSLSTWYRPQAVVEGGLVNWLQAVTGWRSFRVAGY
jgi:hypothetical protein